MLKDIIVIFCACCVELPQLVPIEIPSRYISGPFEYLELHIFVDSSKVIFRAFAFHRAYIASPSGYIKPDLAFVLGKACVAPMNIITVPKLELQGALLAGRLIWDICRALNANNG